MVVLDFKAATRGSESPLINLKMAFIHLSIFKWIGRGSKKKIITINELKPLSIGLKYQKGAIASLSYLLIAPESSSIRAAPPEGLLQALLFPLTLAAIAVELLLLLREAACWAKLLAAY